MVDTQARPGGLRDLGAWLAEVEAAGELQFMATLPERMAEGGAVRGRVTERWSGEMARTGAALRPWTLVDREAGDAGGGVSVGDSPMRHSPGMEG